jgi:hypothetical protein
LGTFALACEYIRALYEDPQNPLFRQVISEGDIESLLIASLVHDVGHYPLAHDLEEVDYTIFNHEDRTSHLLTAPGSQLNDLLAATSAAPDNWSVDVQRVLSVLKSGGNRSRPSSDNRPIVDQILHSIIDGPIDADKLDYLTRDSENLRLPYGRGVDVAKLVQSLTVVVDTNTSATRARIGIHERGKIAAESVAFARYAMYGAVYWHHSHRAAKAMLNHIAYRAVEQAHNRDTTAEKRAYKKRLKKVLYAFLDDLSSTEPVLPFEAARQMPRSPFIDEGSEKMFHWLDEMGGGVSKQLVQGLLDRRLYKRLAVFSKPGNNAIDWGPVEALYGRLGVNWRRKMWVNENVQREIILKAREHAGISLAGNETLARLEGWARQGQIILVDFPPDKPGSDVGLEYLREGPVGEGLAFEPLQRSPVWRALRNEGGGSLAKLRIFCHENARDSIQGMVSNRELQRIVNDMVAASAEAEDDDEIADGTGSQ